MRAAVGSRACPLGFGESDPLHTLAPVSGLESRRSRLEEGLMLMRPRPACTPLAAAFTLCACSLSAAWMWLCDETVGAIRSCQEELPTPRIVLCPLVFTLPLPPWGRTTGLQGECGRAWVELAATCSCAAWSALAADTCATLDAVGSMNSRIPELVLFRRCGALSFAAEGGARRLAEVSERGGTVDTDLRNVSRGAEEGADGGTVSLSW
mmetsp:Transcript_11984/g.26660  ORF Transcript_11984/g.26660 Transcript_11984/m.26660 type:complete len:209 (+) Transcript_11984:200-826(+)